MTPPEVTDSVIVMVERMKVLGRRDPELARLLDELSPYLPIEASGPDLAPRPIPLRVPVR